MAKEYAIFLVLALLSEVVGTVSGFGSSILFVPMASLFFDFKTVLGLTAVFHVFSNISKIALFRRGIDLKIAIRLGLPAIICVIAGAYLTTVINTEFMPVALNVVLVSLAIYLIAHFDKRLAPTNANLVAGGSASGLMAGLAGTGGAIRGITLASFGLPKDIYIATSAMIDLGVDLSRSVVYVYNGYFPPALIFMIPFFIIVSFAGGYAGKALLRRVSERKFRYLTLVLIIASSLVQVGRYMLF